MEIIKEITEWNESDYQVPNHTYAVNKAGKCVAYKDALTDEWMVFRKPLMFEKTRRKFITIEKDVGMEYVL